MEKNRNHKAPDTLVDLIEMRRQTISDIDRVTGISDASRLSASGAQPSSARVNFDENAIRRFLAEAHYEYFRRLLKRLAPPQENEE